MPTHVIISGPMPAGDGTIANPGRTNNFDGNNSIQFSSGTGLLAKHPSDGRVAIIAGFWSDSSDVNFPNFFNSNTVQISTDATLAAWNTYHDTDFSPSDTTHNAFGAAQNAVMSVLGSNDILIVVPGLTHAVRCTWAGVFSNTAALPGGATLNMDVVPVELLDGRIFVGTASDSSAYLYHPGTDSWEAITAPAGDHTGGATALLSDGNVLLIGGGPSVGGNKVEVLKVSDMSWHVPFGGLLTNRQLFSFTPLGSDNFLIAGGLDSSNATLASCEVFTYVNSPSIGGFLNATGNLSVARYGPLPSFLLPDNVTVAVFGGVAGITFAALDSIELFDASGGFPFTGGTWSTDSAHLSQPKMGLGGLQISSSPMKFWMPGGETFDAGVVTFDRVVQTADVWTEGGPGPSPGPRGPTVPGGSIVPLGSDIVKSIGDTMLGVDFLFTGRMPTGPSGDYQYTSGVNYLRQRVYHRLITAPGSYRPRPEYGAGIKQLVKKKMTASILREAEARTVANLLQDPQFSKATVTMTRQPELKRLRVEVSVVAFGRVFTLKPFFFSEEG